MPPAVASHRGGIDLLPTTSISYICLPISSGLRITFVSTCTISSPFAGSFKKAQVRMMVPSMAVAFSGFLAMKSSFMAIWLKAYSLANWLASPRTVRFAFFARNMLPKLSEPTSILPALTPANRADEPPTFTRRASLVGMPAASSSFRDT